MTENKRKILYYLDKIITEGVADHPNCGLCVSIMLLVGGGYREVKPIVDSWPLAVNTLHHPIEGSFDSHTYQKHKWTVFDSTTESNKNAIDRRWNLTKWLHEQLTFELEGKNESIR